MGQWFATVQATLILAAVRLRPLVSLQSSLWCSLSVGLSQSLSLSQSLAHILSVVSPSSPSAIKSPSLVLLTSYCVCCELLSALCLHSALDCIRLRQIPSYHPSLSYLHTYFIPIPAPPTYLPTYPQKTSHVFCFRVARFGSWKSTQVT